MGLAPGIGPGSISVPLVGGPLEVLKLLEVATQNKCNMRNGHWLDGHQDVAATCCHRLLRFLRQSGASWPRGAGEMVGGHCGVPDAHGQQHHGAGGSRWPGQGGVILAKKPSNKLFRKRLVWDLQAAKLFAYVYNYI